MTYKIAMVAQERRRGQIDAGTDNCRRGHERRAARPRSPTWTHNRPRASTGPQGGLQTAWSRRIRAETFRSVDTALQDAENFDLYIFDGAPHSSAETQGGLPLCRHGCHSDKRRVGRSPALRASGEQSAEGGDSGQQGRFRSVHHVGFGERDRRGARVPGANPIHGVGGRDSVPRRVQGRPWIRERPSPRLHFPRFASGPTPWRRAS